LGLFWPRLVWTRYKFCYIITNKYYTFLTFHKEDSLIPYWFRIRVFFVCFYVHGYLSQAKWGGSLKILCRDRLTSSLHQYVTSFSSDNNKPRDFKFKFGMHIPYLDGSKVTVQIFDILPRRWDMIKVLYLHLY